MKKNSHVVDLSKVRPQFWKLLGGETRESGRNLAVKDELQILEVNSKGDFRGLENVESPKAAYY